MANEIPTTTRVPPWSETMDESLTKKWFQALAGFIQGIQGVKSFETTTCTRIGPLVTINGELEVAGTSSAYSLPVVPRLAGFLNLAGSDGKVYAAKFSAKGKTLSCSGVPDGMYLVQGCYLADPRGE